jgi:DNA-binding MarR family transcriptional regulator
MSFRALHAAWLITPQTASGKNVLYALAGYHNELDNLCCPSQSSLAKRTGLSVDTVGRTIKDLEAEGLIKRHVRRNPATGERYSDRYDLLFASPRQLALLLTQQADEDEAAEQVRNLQGHQLASPGIGDTTPHHAPTPLIRNDHGVSPHHADETRNQPGKVSSGKMPDATKAQVDEVWAAIPDQRAKPGQPKLPDIRKRSESKGEVGKALSARLKEGHAFDRVLAGVVAYYADPDVAKVGPDGPYHWAKGAQRVIRNGLWETYLPDDQDDDDGDDLFAARQPDGLVATSQHVDLVADWQGAVWLDEWLDNPGSWRGERGPQPGHQGCRVNPDLLTAKGIRPWTP